MAKNDFASLEERLAHEAKQNKKARSAVNLHCLFSAFILICAGVRYRYMLFGNAGEKALFIVASLAALALEIYFIYQTVVHMEHYNDLLKKEEHNGKKD